LRFVFLRAHLVKTKNKLISHLRIATFLLPSTMLGVCFSSTLTGASGTLFFATGSSSIS
jgi:hypothetical protein